MVPMDPIDWLVDRRCILDLEYSVLCPSGLAAKTMNHKTCRRKTDLFSLVVIVVALAMTATIAYQVNVYYGAQAVPIAKQTPAPGGVGG